MIGKVVGSQYEHDGQTLSLGTVTKEIISDGVVHFAAGESTTRYLALRYHFDKATTNVRSCGVTLVFIEVNKIAINFDQTQWDNIRGPRWAINAYIESEHPRTLKVWDGQTNYKITDSFLISPAMATDIACHFLETALPFPGVRWVTFAEVGWSTELPWDEMVTYEGDCVWLTK